MLAIVTALASLALSAEAPTMLEPKGPWVVDGEEGLCLLARSYDTPTGALTIGFEPVATQDRMEVLMKYPATGNDYIRRGQATLTLLPENVPVSASFSSFMAGKGRRSLRLSVSRSVYDNMPKATALSISADKSFVLALRNPGGAVAALQKCETALLQHWGIDSVALAAAKTPAHIADVVKWFTPSAYPKDALAHHFSGRVVAILSVNELGTVQNCRVVVSSRNDSLDQGTCGIVMRHQRISPALDAAGKPVASWLILPVRWLVF